MSELKEQFEKEEKDTALVMFKNSGVSFPMCSMEYMVWLEKKLSDAEAAIEEILKSFDIRVTEHRRKWQKPLKDEIIELEKQNKALVELLKEVPELLNQCCSSYTILNELNELSNRINNHLKIG